MKILLIFLVFIVNTQCIYEHNLVHDVWVKRLFGQMESAIINNNRITFRVKNSQNFGVLDSQNGDLSFLYDNEKQLVKNSYNLINDNQDVFYFDQAQNLLTRVSSFNGNPEKQYIVPGNNKQVIAIIETKDGMHVVSENKIILISGQNKQVQAHTAANESIIQVHRKNQEIYVVTQKELSISLYLIDNWSMTSLDHMLFSQKLQNEIEINKIGFQQDIFTIQDKKQIYLYFTKTTNKGKILHRNNCQKLFFIQKSEYLVCESDFQLQIYQVAEQHKEFHKEVTKIQRFNQEQSTFRPYTYLTFQSSLNGQKNQILFSSISQYGVLTIQKIDLTNLFENLVVKTQIQGGASSIDQIWTYSNSNDSNDFNLLIQTKDLQILFYNNKQNKIIWKRDESLTQIQETLWVKYNQIESLVINDYYESLQNNGAWNLYKIQQNLIYRFKYELEEMNQTINNYYNILMNILKSVNDIRSISQLNQLFKQSEDQSYEVFYGLKQIILIYTKQNTLIALDSTHGEQIFRHYLSEFDSQYFEMKGIFSLQSNKQDAITTDLIICFYNNANQSLNFYKIDPINGQLSNLIQEYFVEDLTKMVKIPISDKFKDEGIMIIDSNKKALLYPLKLSQVFQSYQNNDDDSFVFYNYNSKSNEIFGFQLIQNELLKLWNIQLKSDEILLYLKSPSSTDPNALSLSFNGISVGVAEDQKVLFKNADYNYFTIVSKIQDNSSQVGQLNVYIVNGVTGRIVLNSYIDNINFDYKINLVMDINSVFLSYYNQINQKYEFFVVESYYKQFENSVSSMFEKNFPTPQYHEKNPQIIFLKQKFGMPFGIKYFTNFHSREGITKRNILIITDRNQIYSLDRNLLSPRRSIKDQFQTQDNPFQSKTLPPYDYEIPIDSTQYISFFLNLHVNSIETSPTNLESTSLLLSYGQDIFFSKFAPENAFDRLNEDFNQIFLIATVILVCVATYIARQLANKNKINPNFLA